MLAISLQSGSNGNCIYVESEGVRLLFDAGICGKKAEKALASFNRDIRNVDAVIISHDHADHIRYAGVYQRKYGLPVYMTPQTLKKAEREGMLGKLKDVRYFWAFGRMDFGGVSVSAIPTPHDAEDGAAFIVSCKRKKLGILTDLGHPFGELYSVIAQLDAVFIESNYDLGMLEKGTYPASLKKRIRGERGHLSNRESAELLRAGKKLKWACLAHLSENNNDPAVALKTHADIVGKSLTLHTASRYKPSSLLKV